MDLKSAIVVLNEAEFPKFVHEKVDSGPRGANHLRQRFLPSDGDCYLWNPIVRKKVSHLAECYYQVYSLFQWELDGGGGARRCFRENLLRGRWKIVHVAKKGYCLPNLLLA